MTQYTGQCYLQVDGQMYGSKEGASIETGNVERDDVTGSGVLGFTEKASAPMVNADFAHGNGLDPVAVHAKTKNSTVTFECDTGEVYLLRNAWSAKKPKLTGAFVTFEFHGTSTIRQ